MLRTPYNLEKDLNYYKAFEFSPFKTYTEEAAKPQKAAPSVLSRLMSSDSPPSTMLDKKLTAANACDRPKLFEVDGR